MIRFGNNMIFTWISYEFDNNIERYWIHSSLGEVSKYTLVIFNGESILCYF